jgi:hypothetical protein
LLVSTVLLCLILVAALGILSGCNTRFSPNSKDPKEYSFKELTKGWRSESLSNSYRVALVHDVTHTGSTAGLIENSSAGPADFTIMSRGETAVRLATINQVIRADNYRGQRIRLFAFVKTEKIEQMGCIWMRFDDDSRMLLIDEMDDRPITGTRDWTRYEIIMDVPKDAVRIVIGGALRGQGKIWVDDFQLDVVPESVPQTGAVPLAIDLVPGVGQRTTAFSPVNMGLEE